MEILSSKERTHTVIINREKETWNNKFPVLEKENTAEYLWKSSKEKNIKLLFPSGFVREELNKMTEHRKPNQRTDLMNKKSINSKWWKLEITVEDIFMFYDNKIGF